MQPVLDFDVITSDLAIWCAYDPEVKAELYSTRLVADGEEICDRLRVIAIDGAAPGEIVLHYGANGGTLIIGDAVINFEPYGFAFLPAKYCSDQSEMCRSLRKLLDCEAERILFAHGTPILSQASQRLEALLISSL